MSRQARLSRALLRRLMSSSKDAKSDSVRRTHNPLFVTGRRGTNVTNVVIPDFNFGENADKLRDSLRARGREGEISELDKMVKGAEYIEYLEGEERDVGERLAAARSFAQEAKKAGRSLEDSAEGREVKASLEELKAKARTLKQDRWDLEESVLIPSLELPNVLDEETPIDEDRVVFSSVGADQLAFDFERRDHVELAGPDLHFPPSGATRTPYLFGRLAALESELQWAAWDHLVALPDFSPLAAPDLAKSVAVEGSGAADFSDPSATFCLRETAEFGNRTSGQGMHVVGGASTAALASFFSKTVVRNPAVLPRGYFCLGKQYRPVPGSDEPPSLFNTEQSTAVEIIDLSAHETDARNLKHVLSSCRDFYESCSGLDGFRFVSRHAAALSAAESARVAFEAVLPGGRYVEVGHLSVYGTHLAERFMLKAEDPASGELLNLRVLAGTLVDITKLIGCLVESGQDKEGNYELPKLKNKVIP